MKSATVVDLENDRLYVEFDPTRVTPQQLLQAVTKQGFSATVVPEAPAPP